MTVPASTPGTVPKNPALVEMAKIVVSVRWAISIASSKSARLKRIVAVGDDDDDASAGSVSQFFVGKLPDRIVKRGLRTGLFDFINRFVEQIQFVGKILPQD